MTLAANTLSQLSFRIALTSIMLAGCVGSQTAAADSPPRSNDFPTQARVEYVLQCMQNHGGQNYDTLYHCVCAADSIASKMSYDEFSQAQTFTYLFNTPGERGAEFRDPPLSAKLRTLLKDAAAAAESSCFPKSPKGKGTAKP